MAHWDRVNLILPRGNGWLWGALGPVKLMVLLLQAGLQLPTSGEPRLFDQQQTYLRLDQTDPQDVRLVFPNFVLVASDSVEYEVVFLLRKWS